TLIGVLGQTAYFVLIVWFAVLLALLQRRALGIKLARIIGWMMLIPCAAAWAAFLAMPATFFPDATPGGALGAWLDSFLRTQYPPTLEVWILTCYAVLS